MISSSTTTLIYVYLVSWDTQKVLKVDSVGCLHDRVLGNDLIPPKIQKSEQAGEIISRNSHRSQLFTEVGLQILLYCQR